MTNEKLFKCTEEEFKEITGAFAAAVSYTDTLYESLKKMDSIVSDKYQFHYYLKRRDLREDARTTTLIYLEKLCSLTDLKIKVGYDQDMNICIVHNGVHILLGSGSTEAFGRDSIYKSFMEITSNFFDAIATIVDNERMSNNV